MAAIDAPSVPEDSSKPPARRRKFVIIGIAAATILLVVGAVVAVNLSSGRSLGALYAQLQGDVVVHEYDEVADAPAGVLPTWTPAARDIDIVTPGDDTDNVGTVVSFAVTGAEIPDECSAADGYNQPWFIDDSLPEYSAVDLHICGDWTLLVDDDHWHLWTAETLR